MRILVLALCLIVTFSLKSEKLIFEDNFDKLDFSTWNHELTMSGGGNWEFEMYTNNRTNSYVKDGVLYLQPTLTEEAIGYDALFNGEMSIWGGAPADLCTSNSDWGCDRTGTA